LQSPTSVSLSSRSGISHAGGLASWLNGYASPAQPTLIGIAPNYLCEQYSFTRLLRRFLYGAKYEFYHLRRILQADVPILLTTHEEKYIYSQDATEERFATQQQ
jgi:hypothetical protein